MRYLGSKPAINSSDTRPYYELLVAVIQFAIEQVAGIKVIEKKYINDARDFIFTNRLDRFIYDWGLDIEPDYVRRITKKLILIKKG